MGSHHFQRLPPCCAAASPTQRAGVGGFSSRRDEKRGWGLAAGLANVSCPPHAPLGVPCPI